MFVNSARTPSILRKRKIKYIVKNVNGTVLNKTVSIATMTFARKFINVEIAIRLN
jgi:hypothetical protein